MSKIYMEVLIPKRTNIGLAVVNGKGEVFYAANVTTRNQEDRAQHRKASHIS